MPRVTVEGGTEPGTALERSVKEARKMAATARKQDLCPWTLVHAGEMQRDGPALAQRLPWNSPDFAES